MSRQPPDPGHKPPSNKWIRIFGTIVILFLVIGSLVAIVQGTGEAVGIEEAAPGGANAEGGR